MLGSCATRRMLRRIEREDCFPQPTVDTFFNELAAEIGRHPAPAGGPSAAAASWAADCVLRVVDSLSAIVLAAGAAVPAQQFDMAARVRSARAYRWALPPDAAAAFFRDFFITNAAWKAASDDELRTWIEEHETSYPGGYATGGESGVAFVSDAAAIPVPRPSFAELQNLLALVLQPGDDTLGLFFTYPRSAVEASGCPLRLPRAFDGLPYARFGLELDCSAAHGRTVPFHGQPGLPEAVHRGCEIPSRPVTSCEVIQ